VRRSKDGQLVCVHDDDVKRTTGQPGTVADLTLAELKKLDAGKSFDSAFTGQKVPTLEEVVVMLKQRQVPSVLVALDFKADDDATLTETVKLVVKHGLLAQVVCIGKAIDNPEVRKKLKAADSRVPVAVLAQTSEELDKALADKDADWAYVRFVPTAEQVAKAHQADKRVFLVGPLVAGQEPANWKKARDAGVDAMLTDYPLECRQTWRGTPLTP
jgi:glycerophosphoryl diester phosphodiesterase